MPATRGTDRRGIIPKRTSICDWPVQVEERLVSGPWEGDLIKGSRNASIIVPLIERNTWFVTLTKMKNASAEAAVTRLSAVHSRIDVQ
ncbi:MAG TPA: IS30 family transposase, partial [Nitrospira sp.]|nr:IS30 family transposase [Nitrospira sp.]